MLSNEFAFHILQKMNNCIIVLYLCKSIKAPLGAVNVSRDGRILDFLLELPDVLGQAELMPEAVGGRAALLLTVLVRHQTDERHHLRKTRPGVSAGSSGMLLHQKFSCIQLALSLGSFTQGNKRYFSSKYYLGREKITSKGLVCRFLRN